MPPYAPGRAPIKITTKDGRRLIMPWSEKRDPTPAEVDAWVAKQPRQRSGVGPLAPARDPSPGISPRRREARANRAEPNPVLVAAGIQEAPPKQITQAQREAAKPTLAARNKVIDENFGVPEHEIQGASNPVVRQELTRRQQSAQRRAQEAQRRVATLDPYKGTQPITPAMGYDPNDSRAVSVEREMAEYDLRHFGGATGGNRPVNATEESWQARESYKYTTLRRHGLDARERNVQRAQMDKAAGPMSFEDRLAAAQESAAGLPGFYDKGRATALISRVMGESPAIKDDNDLWLYLRASNQINPLTGPALSTAYTATFSDPRTLDEMGNLGAVLTVGDIATNVAGAALTGGTSSGGTMARVGHVVRNVLVNDAPSYAMMIHDAGGPDKALQQYGDLIKQAIDPNSNLSPAQRTQGIVLAAAIGLGFNGLGSKLKGGADALGNAGRSAVESIPSPRFPISERRAASRALRESGGAGVRDLDLTKNARIEGSAPEVSSVRKAEQLQVILKANQAPNDRLAWIRSESDIRTFKEASEDGEYDTGFSPDFTLEDIGRALESGELTVYSSYPIEPGVFVTPSRMEAESYSGNGQVFSKDIKIEDVAWLDVGQGQYAPTNSPQPQPGKGKPAPKSRVLRKVTISTAAREKASGTVRAFEVDDLHPSHLHDGSPNPTFRTDGNESQNRARSGKSQTDRIRQRAAHPDFDELMDPGGKVSFAERSLSTVTDSGQGVAGHGRLATLKLMRDEYPENWAEYQRRLKEEYPELRDMKDPVLVNVLDDGSPAEVARIGRSSNTSAADKMSDIEVAVNDSMGFSQFSTKIALTEKTRLALETKFGYNELREFLKREGLYDGEHGALTESEGRTLLRAGSLDEARERIAEARPEGVSPTQSGVLPEEPSGSSTQKVDDDTQAMRPVKKSAAAVADEQLKSIIDEVPTRVKLDPLPKPSKYKATSTRRIVLQLQRGLKKGIHIGRTPKGSLGIHSKASGKIIIRFAGDIDATAHEIGHNLDRNYGLQKDLPDGTAKVELLDFFERFGERGYDPARQGISEGVAEYIRGYLVNPAETKKLAPEFTKWFESKAAPAMPALKEFSDQIRIWGGLSELEMTKAQIGQRSQTGILDAAKKFVSPKDAGEIFELSGWGRLKQTLLDDAAPIEEAVNLIQRRLGGKDDLLPSQDPMGLVSDLRYVDYKIDSFLENGIPLGNGKRTPGLKAIFEPLAEGDGRKVRSPEIRELVKDLNAFMVSQRVVEKGKQFIAEAYEEAQRIMDDTEIPIGEKEARSLEILQKAVERTERLSGVGGGVYGDLNIAKGALKELIADPAKLARLQKAAKAYRDIADGVLQYGVQNGRWTAEFAQYVRSKNEHYVAMQRVMEDGQAFAPHRRLTRSGEVFYEWKGSTREIKDPVDNLIGQIDKAIYEVDRNATLRSLRDLVVKGDKENDQGKTVDLSDIMARAEPDETDNILKIFVNGNLERWRINNSDLKAAMDIVGQTFIPSGWAPAVKALGLPVSIMRKFITTSPQFIVRNLLRDTAQRAIVSEVDLKHRKVGADWLKSASKDEMTMMREHGGSLMESHFDPRARSRSQPKIVGGKFYLEDAATYQHVQENVIRHLSGSTGEIVITRARDWSRIMSKLSASSEIRGRVSEFRSAYREALDKGLTGNEAEIYAARKARGLLDYMRSGAVIRAMNRLIPFLNANIQGFDRELRSLRRQPVKYGLKWTATAVMPSIATAMLAEQFGYGDDYDQLPAWQKDMFYNFKVEGFGWIRIPKPFQAGVMASGVERAYKHVRAKSMGNDKEAARAFEGYWHSLLASMALVNLDDVAGGGWAPLVELATNWDMFRGSNIRNIYEEGSALELKSDNDRASTLGKAIASAVNQDPANIDHIIRRFGGGWGQIATTGSDLADTNKRVFQNARYANLLSGLATEDPVSQARDVQWVTTKAKYYQLHENPLKAELDAVYNAKTIEDRNAAVERLIEAAKAKRDAIEEQSKGRSTRDAQAAIKQYFWPK